MNGEENQSTPPSMLKERIAQRYGIPSNELYALVRATAFKQKGKDATIATDEQITALFAVADRYGLDIFTKELFAFPDNGGIIAVVSVDGWSRIINEHPSFDGIEFNYSTELEAGLEGLLKPVPEWIECVIYRRDRTKPIIVREYAIECYRPPFSAPSKYENGKPYVVTGPWQSHPRRMLRHKAEIQCARLAFGFAGLNDEDEATRIVDMGVAQEIDPTSSTTTSYMPRALTDDPSPIANFNAGATKQGENVEQRQDDPLDVAVAERPEESAKQAKKASGKKAAEPDYTAAPNRFDRPKAQPARKSTNDQTRAAPQESATPEQRQPTFFEDVPQNGETPPAEPLPDNMLRILKRKMEIAGKTEVDLKAKFNLGFDQITKAEYNAIQSWVSA